MFCGVKKKILSRIHTLLTGPPMNVGRLEISQNSRFEQQIMHMKLFLPRKKQQNHNERNLFRTKKTVLSYFPVKSSDIPVVDFWCQIFSYACQLTIYMEFLKNLASLNHGKVLFVIQNACNIYIPIFKTCICVLWSIQFYGVCERILKSLKVRKTWVLWV